MEIIKDVAIDTTTVTKTEESSFSFKPLFLYAQIK